MGLCGQREVRPGIVCVARWVVMAETERGGAPCGTSEKDGSTNGKENVDAG
jgi:hypothetical protein